MLKKITKNEYHQTKLNFLLSKFPIKNLSLGHQFKYITYYHLRMTIINTLNTFKTQHIYDTIDNTYHTKYYKIGKFEEFFKFNPDGELYQEFNGNYFQEMTKQATFSHLNGILKYLDHADTIYRVSLPRGSKILSNYEFSDLRSKN